jgi:hypothetical protein
MKETQVWMDEGVPVMMTTSQFCEAPMQHNPGDVTDQYDKIEAQARPNMTDSNRDFANYNYSQFHVRLRDTIKLFSACNAKR